MNENNVKAGNGESMNAAMTLQDLMGRDNFTEAAALPEWGGFWFKSRGKVYVFTRENILLDTPDYAVYGHRTDWTAVKSNPEMLARLTKALRIRTSEMENVMNAKVFQGREASLAKTALQTAFMWMGMMLHDIGTPTPYPASTDRASEVIEKPADKADPNQVSFLVGSMEGLSEIGVVKALRQELQNSVDVANWIGNKINMSDRTSAYPSSMAVTKSLIESKMWLGQQLNMIMNRDMPVTQGTQLKDHLK